MRDGSPENGGSGSLAGSLEELGLVSERRARHVQEWAESTGRPPESALLDSGEVSPEDLLAAARHRWTVRQEAAGATRSPSGLSLRARDLARRFRLARATRIAATAMASMASVLALEIAVTLVWAEPISGLVAGRAQAGLEEQLAAISQPLEASGDRADAGERPRSRGQGAERQRRRSAARLAGSARAGDALGRIAIPGIDASYVVVQGTGSAPLSKGPGHFPDTAVPGQGKTVAVAGHRTTFGAPFGNIDQLEVGDPVVMEMPYGRYTYEVERTLVVYPDDTWVTGRAGHERLVLTTCHPPFSARQRYVVYARLAQAPGPRAS